MNKQINLCSRAYGEKMKNKAKVCIICAESNPDHVIPAIYKMICAISTFIGLLSSVTEPNNIKSVHLHV